MNNQILKHKLLLSWTCIALLFVVLAGCSEPPRPTISIHQAAKLDNIEQLEHHIYWGTDVNTVVENDETPIRYQIGNNLIQISQNLTALHYAVANNQADAIDLLLKNGADIHKSVFSGYSTLHLAIIFSDDATVQTLIDHGANINATVRSKVVLENDSDVGFQDGFTPLLVAVAVKNSNVVQMLLTAGADAEQVSTDRDSPLMLSILLQDRTIFDQLLNANVSLDQKNELGTAAIHIAAMVKDVGFLESLASSGANLAAIDNQDKSVIHYASMQNFIEPVAWLIEKGVDINATAKTSVKNNPITPLLIAAAGANNKVVNLFLMSGAIVDLKNQTLMNYFVRSAASGHYETVKNLLGKGMSANSKGVLTDLPLKSTSLKTMVGRIDFVEMHYLNSLTTSVHQAALLGEYNLLKLLIQYGGSVDGFKNISHTPLDLAVTNNQPEIINYLLDTGANINKRSILNLNSSTEYPPIVHAIKSNRLDIVKLLIGRGADINLRGINFLGDGEDRPIHIAAEEGNIDLVNVLIENGAKINTFQRESKGYTPLQIAAEKGDYNLVKYLLEHGAKKNLRASKYTDDFPITLAIDNGYSKVVDLLKKN